MNPETNCNRSGLAYVVGILGSFLIVAALAWAIHQYTQPPPLAAARAEERAKALSELRAAETEALHNPGWVDQSTGLVRLRIEDAMEIVEREWGRNPAAARSNLIARVEKANPPPPPKAPEKPSQFE
jgi:hypothetical protein